VVGSDVEEVKLLQFTPHLTPEAGFTLSGVFTNQAETLRSRQLFYGWCQLANHLTPLASPELYTDLHTVSTLTANLNIWMHVCLFFLSWLYCIHCFAGVESDAFLF